MKAKEYLQQVGKIDRMIQNKLIEKEQWFSVATGITSHNDGDRVQSTSSQQKMADAVTKYVDIDAEINQYIDSLIDTKKDVIRTIEMLNGIEYDMLHKVYIQNHTLYDVAANEKKTYTWATTVHGRALKHVQDILDDSESN